MKTKPELDFSTLKVIKRRRKRQGPLLRLFEALNRIGTRHDRSYSAFPVRYIPNARTTPTHRDYSK